MTNKCREILRLHSQGISNRCIAVSLECSRNTVRKLLTMAEETGLSWPLPETLTDKALEAVLFGEQNTSLSKKLPDFEYIHREMAKNGVTLSLLWEEYCEGCRIEGNRAFMYSQFCNLYRQYALGTKATLHIEHKPGERLEVDWAGDALAIQNTITGKSIPVYVFVAVLPCSGYVYTDHGFTRGAAYYGGTKDGE